MAATLVAARLAFLSGRSFYTARLTSFNTAADWFATTRRLGIGCTGRAHSRRPRSTPIARRLSAHLVSDVWLPVSRSVLPLRIWRAPAIPFGHTLNLCSGFLTWCPLFHHHRMDSPCWIQTIGWINVGLTKLGLFEQAALQYLHGVPGHLVFANLMGHGIFHQGYAVLSAGLHADMDASLEEAARVARRQQACALCSKSPCPR